MKSSFRVLLLATALMTIISSNLNWTKDHWKYMLEADAKGYYAYLPAVFIYHDLNFGFFDHIEKEKYFHENLYYDYRSGGHGHTINKYYCGTAVAELPFFLIAHAVTWLKDADTDGYSKWYMIGINAAALCYLFIGLLFILRTLHIYNFSEKIKSIVILAIAFGTNIFYYTVGEPGLSHIFSFAFISAFIFYGKKYLQTNTPKHLIYLGALLGIIILIRPVNGLIIFSLPFLANNIEALRKGLKQIVKHPRALLLGALSCLAILSIQLIIYKISTGKFWVYAYGEEGFNFWDPHFWDILFSYRKGLFLYTPMYLLSLLGFFALWRRNRFASATFLAFFTLLTYILSSWWMWYYGGSFSSRVYVEYLPLFAIGLAMVIGDTSGNWRRGLITTIVALVIVCQIQTYQYRYYEIHWSEMNKEKYWDTFLRIDKLIK